MNEIPITLFDVNIAEIKCHVSRMKYYNDKENDAQTDQWRQWYDRREEYIRQKETMQAERRRLVDQIVGKFDMPEIK